MKFSEQKKKRDCHKTELNISALEAKHRDRQVVNAEVHKRQNANQRPLVVANRMRLREMHGLSPSKL